MICKKCNHEYPDDMEVCPICGEPRPEADASAEQSVPGRAGANAYGASAVPPQQNWSMPAAQPAVVPAVQRSGDSRSGVAPLVLGILSLLIPYVGIVLGILAIVFGSSARKTNPKDSADAALGRAGWVLGIVGLVFQAIVVIWLVFAFSMIFSLVDYIGNINYGNYGSYAQPVYPWWN